MSLLTSRDELTATLLWRLCLDIAQLRRTRQWPQGPSRLGVPAQPSTGEGEVALQTLGSASDAPLAWGPARGWSLCGPWDAPEVELFGLLKPVLDRSPGGDPWLIGQLGQSLDGRIATQTGHSCYVTGADNLEHLHRLRALCDAVIVGAGTVASDDPQLTTRRVAGPNPVRVVLDPTLRTPAEAGVFTDGQAPTLLACDARREEEAAARVGAERVLAVPGLCGEDDSLHLAPLVKALGARGWTVLFVEGGGVTVSRFLAQRLLDRLHLTIAPVIIGEGRAGLTLPGTQTMDECLRPPCRVFGMGADILWDLDLAGVR